MKNTNSYCNKGETMVNFTRKPRYGYEDLLEIIRLLRSPEGCPWDKVQTHASIRRGLLEEAYEAAEAIDLDDAGLLQEELGDVLFAAVKVGRFAGIDPEEAVAGTCEKFIRRFRAVEDGARQQGRTLEDMSLEEMTRLWNRAK